MGMSGRLPDKVKVCCGLMSSPRCKGEWEIGRTLWNKAKRENSGRVVCLYCARHAKSGRNNPNAKYAINDSMFSQIDSEEKAYLLGWIASDGTIGKSSITIAVHKKDADCLAMLRDIVCKELPIVARNGGNLVALSFSSKQIVSDVCAALDVRPGKKSATLGFPHSLSPEMKWAYIRGVFDGDGSVTSVAAAVVRAKKGWPEPRCSIASNSKRSLEAIREFAGIPCHQGPDVLQWAGVGAVDFLGHIYDGARIAMRRKQELYFDWCNWAPGLSGPACGGAVADIRWLRTRHDAVAPRKYSASDSGYDLHVVAKGKETGRLAWYHTGLRVSPPYGWYFDLVARSSIVKTGYMLANGIGVIDSGYTGEVLVPLLKVDDAAPDLHLPARVVQLVLRPTIRCRVVEVDALGDTERGAGGFGSTGT